MSGSSHAVMDLMLIPIKDVIDEVSKIPQATWTVPDPARPPVLRPRSPTGPAPVGQFPVFDDTGFTQPSSPRWREAVDTVRRRLAPGAEGPVPGGPAGVDAVAWYVSFHASPGGWGIYVPLSSLPIVDELYFAHLPIPRAERWRLIWDALLAHEAVHFAVDCACAWFELLHHAPLRWAVHKRMKCFSQGVEALRPCSSYFEAEESLANGHMLRTLVPQAREDSAKALRCFVRVQPPGYRDGETAKSDRGFAVTAAEVLRGYLSVWSTMWNLDPGNPALDLARLLPLDPAAVAQCPVWIVDDLDAAGLPPGAVRFFTCVSPIEETPDFRKEAKRLGLEDAWHRTKEKLKTSIPKSCDFKKWPKAGAGMWSVRVNDDIRAHLRQPQPHSSAGPQAPAQAPWLACEIGGHTAMGHG